MSTTTTDSLDPLRKVRTHRGVIDMTDPRGGTPADTVQLKKKVAAGMRRTMKLGMQGGTPADSAAERRGRPALNAASAALKKARRPSIGQALDAERKKKLGG